MEHIIKLNKKVDKLKMKHLEYEDLIYGGARELHSPQTGSLYKQNEEIERNNDPNIEQNQNEPQQIPQEQKIKPIPKRVKKNWRDNIKYLP
jgi:hypothetical protein